MKLIAFIIAFLLFALGVYMFIEHNYAQAICMFLVLICFYVLADHAPIQ